MAKYLSEVLIEASISANAKLVGFVIGSYTNRSTGLSFPSIRTLSSDCNLSTTTIQVAIKELSRYNIIKIDKIRKYGSNLNAYSFNVSPNDMSLDTSSDMSLDTSSDMSPPATKPIEPNKPIEPKQQQKIIFDGEVLKVYSDKFQEYESSFSGMDLMAAFRDADQFFQRQDDDGQNLESRLEGLLKKSFEYFTVKKTEDKASELAKAETAMKREEHLKKLTTDAAKGDIGAIMKEAAFNHNRARYFPWVADLEFTIKENFVFVIYPRKSYKDELNIWYWNVFEHIAEKRNLMLEYTLKPKVEAA